MIKGPIAELLRRARELQERMSEVQAALEREEVLGRAGGGMVEVRMSGSMVVKAVRIEASLREANPELLEDLLAAAMNDALERARALARERLSALGMAAGLIPGMLPGIAPP